MSENQEVRFQDYAFDPELGTSWLHKRGKGELRSVIDGRELGPTGIGFQIKHIRTGYKKDIPEWAQTNEGIQVVLLRAFPRLHTDFGQRKRAGRWAQVINLYYKNGWSAVEVAEELDQSKASIDMLILGMNRTSQGLNVNGKSRSKSRP